MPDSNTLNLDLAWLYQKGFEIGTGALMALVILAVGWLGSRWAYNLIVRVGTARGLDAALMNFLGQIGRYTLLAAAVIAALGTVGIETTSVMAIFASAGLAVGLALQGSLSNFAAGVMILFFRPFNLGDVVQAAGQTGKVHEIGLFATTLMSPANEKIVLGNASVINGVIVNFTGQGRRRATINFGVAYGSDVDRVCEVALAAANGCAAVQQDPAPPAVAFTDMAASSLNFACHVWADVPDFLAAQHQVRRAIYNGLNEAGIEIPFDQIVVHQA